MKNEILIAYSTSKKNIHMVLSYFMSENLEYDITRVDYNKDLKMYCLYGVRRTKEDMIKKMKDIVIEMMNNGESAQNMIERLCGKYEYDENANPKYKWEE